MKEKKQTRAVHCPVCGRGRVIWWVSSVCSKRSCSSNRKRRCVSIATIRMSPYQKYRLYDSIQGCVIYFSY